MKTFSEFINEINEATKEYVLYNTDYKELWITYAEGSGMTAQLPDLKRYFNSDSSDTEHYDGIVRKLVKWSEVTKPMKQTKNQKVKLFEIPTYPASHGAEKQDLWGGNIKPNGKIYMIVTREKSDIVNFFEKKNEAMNWMKTLA